MNKKKINIIGVKLKRRLSSLYFGVHKSEFKGAGFDLKNLRNYEMGDDSRKIDWVATAKQNNLQVKEMEEDKDLGVLFVLDASYSMNFKSENKTKLDILKETFEILSRASLNFGLKISAIINKKNKIINIKKSNNISNLIKIQNLIGKQATGKNTLEEQLDYLVKTNTKNNLIIILTDKIISGDTFKRLKFLNIKNKIIYINIFDYFENNLHIKNYLNLTNNKNNIFVNLFSDNKRKNYIAYRKEKINKFYKNLKKNNMGYLLLDNKQDIFKTLFKFFARENGKK
ncbi:MAG: DUF58 domain-containing protein [Candidatus Gracilibacteria bacterium]|nr:DUF58 domain-containing protein [Candidatus Gracilibacteria bacterium]